MSKNKAFQAGIGYTIGNILIKGINFISLPVFSRLLTTEEFGIYNVFVSYEAILYVIVGLAIHTSIRSANIKYKDKIDEYTSSVSLLYICNMLLMLLIAILFNGLLSKLLDFSIMIIIFLVLYSFGSALMSLYNNKISLQYEYKKYLLISLCNSLGNIFLSLILILTIFNDHKDFGRILGITITSIMLSAVVLRSFYKKAKPSFNKNYWIFAVKYSIPIVPHGIAQVLLAQFDRIMIRSIVSNSAAGIYSLAGNIKLILTIITESISTAWTTWFYDQIKIGKKELIQKKAVQLAAFFMILTIGLMALSPELIYILGGETYDSAKYVAIPMIIDAFILFLYNIIVPAEYYTGKTQYVMFGTIIAAIINLITNYIFIHMYGFIAAAYTTLFSYICYLILHILISRKLLGFFILSLKWLCIYCFIVIVMAVLDLLFVSSLPVRWGLCAVIVIPISLILLQKSKMINKFIEK